MPPSSAGLTDAILALAFIGDLSMGRSTDHSRRAACLAGWLAQACGADLGAQNHARATALLRWSGCTANAGGFAELLGDDVAAREAMMAQTLPPLSAQTQSLIVPLALIHCEVSGDVAATMGMPTRVVDALRNVFERFDGKGMPAGHAGDAIPETVFFVNVASDLEILSRAHGRENALAFLRSQSDAKYPARLVDTALRHADHWLDGLDAVDTHDTPSADLDTRTWQLAQPDGHADVPLSLLADVTELKLPWLAGFSRRTADLASRTAQSLSLDADTQTHLHAAALLHGIGRAALPNRLWETDGKLSADQWEKVRLVPYWSARAAKQIEGLRAAAELASYAYERLDGSGYFRGVAGPALSTPQRILATSVAFEALLAARPWRQAHAFDEAVSIIERDAGAGKFDPDIVTAIVATAQGRTVPPRTATASANPLLSPRELDVLRQISAGLSNKEAARALALSPSTVRTHVESIFRKLDCSTRAAATLKALTAGML
ncbi:HD domain-containing phosphohydrolase [Pandoraea sp. ISTKB]|uniref:HD domain-containing phosphohydrolase n=1 Tax=Pandoraea sp. ISTKB TaxID=1586708 RepID=UPI000847D002|nr:HD domain-containing phosphohydrolase [Pandoraea sp. ISTKB]ODP32024.1 phosphohydrolase [Pandoraea sp. ISTKB]